MRLMRIDTNKGKQIDGGFAHTVFEKSTMNGRVTVEQLATQKFATVINEQEWIDGMIKDPKKFIEDLNDPQPSEAA